jgi:uncharacterized membrane protein (UPF0136 family)
MSRKKQESLFWGLILLVVGFLILLSNLGVDIDWHSIGKFWPMILIAIGIKNIWQHYINKKSQEER